MVLTFAVVVLLSSTDDNGGFNGSSGGPYVFRDNVVAMHTESSSDVVSFEMLEDSEVQATRTRKRKMNEVEKTMEVAE